MLGYYFFTWQKSSKTFLVQLSTAAFALKTVNYLAEHVKFDSPKNSPLSSSFSISSSSCLVRASSLRSASLGPPVLGGVTWNWNWIRVKRRTAYREINCSFYRKLHINVLFFGYMEKNHNVLDPNRRYMRNEVNFKSDWTKSLPDNYSDDKLLTVTVTVDSMSYSCVKLAFDPVRSKVHKSVLFYIV